MTNGYRYRGFYPPQSQNPYHHPYSKKTQWGTGLQDLLNKMMMMKQMQEGQEQQSWQRGITERETAAMEARTEAMGQKRAPTVPAEIQSAREVEAETGEPVGHILNRWRSRTPKEKEKEDPLTGYLEESLDRYEDRLEKIDSTISRYKTSVMAPSTVDLEGKKSNLQSARDKLLSIQSRLKRGTATDKDKADAWSIGSRVTEIEKLGPYWEKRKGPRRVGENWLMADGQIYEIQKDEKGEYIMKEGVKNYLKIKKK